MRNFVRKHDSNLLVLRQENTSESEILNCLKYVRPGGGYIPKFPVFAKVDVNGENAHPLFAFLRTSLPAPLDDPHPLMGDPKKIIWSPVSRTDISWNFEKFLIRQDGVPTTRYSKKFLTANIANDITKLLQADK